MINTWLTFLSEVMEQGILLPGVLGIFGVTEVLKSLALFAEGRYIIGVFALFSGALLLSMAWVTGKSDVEITKREK